MAAKRGLGKGLNALLELSELDNEIKKVNINEIEPNLKQPRKSFDNEKINELAESIKRHGIIQPIIVKKEKEYYKIIVGERRWRAAKIAGITEIPVIIKDLKEREIMEIALIENIQRQDLNPIEEACAFKELIDSYKITHDELAKILGKSRTAITNTIRLLALSDKVKTALIENKITAGHARAIITLEDFKIQDKILEIIIKNDMTVRDIENYIKKYLNEKERDNKKRATKEEDIIFSNLEKKLQDKLGTKVYIKNNKKDKGKITIEYYSKEELERILDFFN